MWSSGSQGRAGGQRRLLESLPCLINRSMHYTLRRLATYQIEFGKNRNSEPLATVSIPKNQSTKSNKLNEKSVTELSPQFEGSLIFIYTDPAENKTQSFSYFEQRLFHSNLKDTGTEHDTHDQSTCRSPVGGSAL